MSVDLLERDSFLDDLAGLLAAAASGSGRCALVSGVAGIDKSTLIGRFAETCSEAARWY